MMQTKRLKSTVVALVLLGSLAACSESTGPDDINFTGALVPLPQEVTLAIGEEKAVEGSVVRVSFGRVIEDSRCPVDETVQCVWEGRGVVELGVRAGMGPTIPVSLSTQESGRTTVWNGVRLTLVSFEPAPSWNPPVEESAYRVTVRIETDGK